MTRFARILLLLQGSATALAFLAVDDYPYNMLQNKSVVVCACAKCGTSSLYRYVYEVEFGAPWPYQNPPWPQDGVYRNPRWENRFVRASAEQLRDTKTRKFALIRDPRERLVSSWKSKFACDALHLGTDPRDRKKMLPNLRDLAKRAMKKLNIGVAWGHSAMLNITEAADCLSFHKFVEFLSLIHNSGLAEDLDCHMRPQQYGCFRDLGADQWTKIGSIADTELQTALAEALDAPPNVTMPHLHASAPFVLEIDNHTKALLDRVTFKEYKALGMRFRTPLRAGNVTFQLSDLD